MESNCFLSVHTERRRKINCTESIILLFILSFIIAISTHFLSQQFQELIASSFAPVRTSMAKQMSHFCIRPFHSFFSALPFSCCTINIQLGSCCFHFLSVSSSSSFTALVPHSFFFSQHNF